MLCMMIKYNDNMAFMKYAPDAIRIAYNSHQVQTPSHALIESPGFVRLQGTLQ